MSVLGYFSMIIFAVVNILIYKFILRFRVYKFRQMVKREYTKEQIVIHAIKLEREIVKAQKDEAFEPFPVIKNYLEQCSYIVDYGIPAIENAKICPIKQSEQARPFSIELMHAPDRVTKLVLKQSAIIQRIWLLNEPNVAKISQYSNSITLVFLKALLCVLTFISRCFLTSKLEEKEENLRENSMIKSFENSGIITAQ